jgi:large subunit ribosomal protein L5
VSEEAQTDAAESAPKPKKAPAKKSGGTKRATSKKGSGTRKTTAKASADGAANKSTRKSTKKDDGKSADKAKKAEKPVIVARPKSRLETMYSDEVVDTLRSDFGITNPMRVPKPKKIILNIGMGEVITGTGQGRLNMDVIQKAQDDLAAITGQHPVVTKAKKSIANYRLREGMPIGVMVTLRGLRMWQFLDRLVSVALPRVRDFHGVSRNSFDGRGNYSLGLREQIIFPEIDYNRIDRLRGLQVTIVTSAPNDEEARRLLELLGMPFARVDAPVAVLA